MIARWILAALGVALVAACLPDAEGPGAAADATGQTQVDADDPCGAMQYADAVGGTMDAVALPADANVRIYGIGDAITMDFLPDRLNFLLDADGTILRVSCG